jgi:hypothetical protein
VAKGGIWHVAVTGARFCCRGFGSRSSVVALARAGRPGITDLQDRLTQMAEQPIDVWMIQEGLQRCAATARNTKSQRFLRTPDFPDLTSCQIL